MLHNSSQISFIHSLWHSRYTSAVEASFLQSKSFKYVNPHSYAANTSAVVHKLPTSVVATYTDEQILALFTCGFFGGIVFGLERFILSLGGWKLFPARFTGFRDDPSARFIAKKAEISRHQLAPIGSLFFGLFKLLDKQARIENAQRNPAHATESEATSYVDYGFGSDETRFAGCHRFSVCRRRRRKLESVDAISSDGDLEIEIQLQSFTCNPQQDAPIKFSLLSSFHRIYAKLLFADGLRKISNG